jgi:membrane protein YqaA with SNARE-associated domain
MPATIHVALATAGTIVVGVVGFALGYLAALRTRPPDLWPS